MGAFITETEEETAEVGRQLAPNLALQTVVGIAGDLGAGKSVLCRGIAKGLGIRTPVTSPTFTLLKEYVSPQGVHLYHVDLYRIEGEEAMLTAGLNDVLFAPDGITVIEWADRIHNTTPPAKMNQHSQASTIDESDYLCYINIEHVGPGKRRILIPDTWTKGLDTGST